jgi:hypothetical protein
MSRRPPRLRILCEEALVDPEGLERHLARDLDQVGERFRSVEFSTQLYRALTNNRWTKQDELDGAVALSWSRAEGLVNELRGGAAPSRSPLSR